MTLREFIISRVHLYFILVALIFAVSMGVGLIFTPDRAIYYYQLIGPFILAGMCVLRGSGCLSSRLAADVAAKAARIQKADGAAEAVSGGCFPLTIMQDT